MDKCVTVIIINWNNKAFLDRCIASIKKQTFKSIEIIFIDNASADGSYEYIEKYYSDDMTMIKNDKNIGYSGAANQGIRISHGEYLMIINPDIIMEHDFISQLYSYAKEKEEIAAVSGKLLKYDFANDKKLDYIDSAGIVMYRDRTCADRGQNEKDTGQYDEIQQVFGVCGAAPFYKRSALQNIKIEDEYFDEDFFAYKEDIDLSWRFNLAGYKCIYNPNAVAYHGRALGGVKGNFIKTIKHRKSQSKFLRGLSFRNQILMLMKNEMGDSYKRDRIYIYNRIIKTLVYSLFFEQFNFKFFFQALRFNSKMKRKKQLFIKNHSTKFEDISQLIQ